MSINEADRLKRIVTELDTQEKRFSLPDETTLLKQQLTKVEHLGRLVIQDDKTNQIDTGLFKMAVKALKAFISQLEQSEQYAREIEQEYGLPVSDKEIDKTENKE